MDITRFDLHVPWHPPIWSGSPQLNTLTLKMHNRTISQPIATSPSLQEQEKPEKSSQSSSQPAGGSLVGASTLIDFLHAVPAPLVVLLVRLAPSLASLRYVAQILSWQTPWVDCWLLLATWWAAVLFTYSALRSVTFKFP